MPTTSRKPYAFFFPFALLLAAGGCRGCVCSNIAKSIADKPTEEEVKEEAKKELAKSPAKLSTICGVRVSALKDMVVTIVSSSVARHEVKVEGTAVLAAADAGPLEDDVEDADDDAGDDADASGEGGAAPKPSASSRVTAMTTTTTTKDAASPSPSAPILVSPGKAILCVGVVSLSITAVLDADGKRRGWDASNLEVESVATEGVKFEKAKATTSGGRHHRRHHHH